MRSIGKGAGVNNMFLLKPLIWLFNLIPHRNIYDRVNKHLYMVRYYLLFKNRKRFPINATLHKICASDEPTLHDHPWAYFTIILRGGYYEHTPQGVFWRGPGHFRFRRAEQFHWLELKEGKPAWTLFFMGKRKRLWGFLKGGTEWVDSETYLAEKERFADLQRMRQEQNRQTGCTCSLQALKAKKMSVWCNYCSSKKYQILAIDEGEEIPGAVINDLQAPHALKGTDSSKNQ